MIHILTVVLKILKKGLRDRLGCHLVRVHFLAYDVLVDLQSTFHAGGGQTNLNVLNNATSICVLLARSYELLL